MAENSVHRIFHTPEILEAILVELPLRHLLVSQAVCKTWKTVIRGSPKLQNSLFKATDGYVEKQKATREATTGNPRPNALLSRAIYSLGNARKLFHARKCSILLDLDIDCYNPWKDLFLTDPPTFTATVTAEWKISASDKVYHSWRLWNPNGIRLMDVFMFLKIAHPCYAVLHCCHIQSEKVDPEQIPETSE